MTKTNSNDPNTIKVVMIGNKGVGKTTYMASLYGAMQQKMNGFRLKSLAKDDHKRLMELSGAIRNGHYPLGTNVRSEYLFSLHHNDEEVFDFKWADYQGESIRLSGKTSDQANKLHEDLKDADGLMLFCDSNALFYNDIQTNQLGRLISLTQYAIRDIETPFALSIVLTKSDMISGYTRKMIEPFAGLISAINASETVSGSFIPTSCGVHSANVHVPLLYALHVIVIMKALYLNHFIEQIENELPDLDRTSRGLYGALDWVVSRISEVPTNKELYLKKLETLKELQNMQKPVLKSVNSLSHTLDAYPIFEKEKNMDHYVEQLTTVKNLQGNILKKMDSIWEL